MLEALGHPYQLEGQAIATDGDSLTLGGQRVRLFGIDAPERGQTCSTQSGATVACGSRAHGELRRLIQGKRLRCVVVEKDRYERAVATCFIGDQDISRAMVTIGWATAFTAYSRAYVEEERKAKSTKRGLWAMEFQAPGSFRQSQRVARPPPQLPPSPQCAIKGNINRRGERIYHLPESHAYAEVRIDVSQGERWFCSAAQATAAGWRSPR